MKKNGYCLRRRRDNNNNNKIDYSVRNDKVTAQALQEIRGKND